MKHKNSVHPGIILKDLYIVPKNIQITTIAKKLDVTPSYITKIVHGKTNISKRLANKLSVIFNTTSEYWLTLQMNYDLSINIKETKKTLDNKKNKRSC